VFAADTWKLHSDRLGELLHELQGLLVSMRLRQRRKACDVGEEEGCFGIAWHGHNVVVLPRQKREMIREWVLQ